MKQSDLKQFKFDNEKRCVGFYCNLNGRDVIFTKDVKPIEDWEPAYGDVWHIQIVGMQNLLPMDFETPKKGMSLLKIAEYGVSCLLKQIRIVQGDFEELAMCINRELMVADYGK